MEAAEATEAAAVVAATPLMPRQSFPSTKCYTTSALRGLRDFLHTLVFFLLSAFCCPLPPRTLAFSSMHSLNVFSVVSATNFNRFGRAPFVVDPTPSTRPSRPIDIYHVPLSSQSSTARFNSFCSFPCLFLFFLHLSGLQSLILLRTYPASFFLLPSTGSLWS